MPITSPVEIEGLVHWYDANDVSSLQFAGLNVTGMAAQFGDDLDGFSGQIVVDEIAVPNGTRNTLFFDSAEGQAYLHAVIPGAETAGAFTAFAVVRMSSTEDGISAAVNFNGTSDAFVGSANGVHFGADCGAEGNTAQILNTQWHIYIFVSNGAGSILYLDNAPYAMDDPGSNGYATSAIIGSAASVFSELGGPGFFGWYGESGVYDSVLTEGDISDLYDYLYGKWVTGDPIPTETQSVLIPYPDTTLQPQMLYHNILEAPGALFGGSGWTDSGDGDISNLQNHFQNTTWSADGNSAVIDMTFDHVVSANAIGVARHSLDGHSITVEYSDDDGANWFTAGVFAPSVGRVLFMALDGNYTADRWRITISGDTTPSITHLKLGVAAHFERRVYAGVVPSALDRDAKMAMPSGSGGQHYGDRVIRERVNQSLEVKNLSGEWVRVLGKPLLEAARDSSLFCAWRPGKYPNDILYGWTTGDVKTTHSGPARYMDFDIDIEGFDSWN